MRTALWIVFGGKNANTSARALLRRPIRRRAQNTLLIFRGTLHIIRTPNSFASILTACHCARALQGIQHHGPLPVLKSLNMSSVSSQKTAGPCSFAVPKSTGSPATIRPIPRPRRALRPCGNCAKRPVGFLEDAMVILVGDMITEEALPSYASWISTLEGVGGFGCPARPGARKPRVVRRGQSPR